MVHFVIKPDYRDQLGFTRARFLNANEFKDTKLSFGLPLGSLPRFKVDIESKSKPKDFFVAGPLMLISARAANTLKALDAGAEFLPVELSQDGKSLNDEYFVFNVLEKVDALDTKKAKVTFDDGVVDKIEKLAIDSDKVAGIPVARMANTYDQIILCSDRTREELELQGVTGMDFVLPEEWKW